MYSSRRQIAHPFTWNPCPQSHFHEKRCIPWSCSGSYRQRRSRHTQPGHDLVGRGSCTSWAVASTQKSVWLFPLNRRGGRRKNCKINKEETHILRVGDDGWCFSLVARGYESEHRLPRNRIKHCIRMHSRTYHDWQNVWYEDREISFLTNNSGSQKQSTRRLQLLKMKSIPDRQRDWRRQ
jgi:hypothetical protein